MLGAYLQSALLRLDGWANEITGLGTALDKTVAALFGRSANYGDDYYGQLFEDDPLARRICEKPPDEMLRAGFDLPMGDAEDAQELATAVLDELKRLHAIERIKDALVWERVYGGSAILIGAEDGSTDPREPLDEEHLESITHLTVIDKPTIVAARWYGPADEGSGRPMTWTITPVNNKGAAPIEVHESRLIIYPGGRVTHKRRLELQGWGQSVLRAIHDALRDYNMSWAGVTHMMQSANQDVWYMAGFKTAMASGTDAMRAFFASRFNMAQMRMGPNHAIVLDTDSEKFERHPSTLAGIPDTLMQINQRIASIADMPMTVLFGVSPAGLNATGASDIELWNSSCAGKQVEVLQPGLHQLIRLVMLCKQGPTKGEEVDGWSIQFRSLRTLSATEQADLRAKQAGTDKIYMDSQVLLPEEVAQNRFRREGWSPETSIDLDVRRQVLELELKRELEQAENPPEPPPGGADPNADPNAAPNAKPGDAPAVDPKKKALKSDGQLHTDDWDESQHPRAADGKFGSGGGDGGTGDAKPSTRTPQERRADVVATLGRVAWDDIEQGRDDAHATHDASAAALVEHLSDSDKAAITDFTSTEAYQTIVAVESGDPRVANLFPEQVQEAQGHIDAIYHAMAVAEAHGVNKTETLYRGIAVQPGNEQIIDDLLEGRDVSLGSMSSWSTDAGVARAFSIGYSSQGPSNNRVVLSVKTSRGLPIHGTLTRHILEHETILPAGRFRVVSVRAALTRAGKPGGVYAEVEMVDPAVAHADADWDESQHPRDASGKFGSGGGDGSSARGGSATKAEGAASQMTPERSVELHKSAAELFRLAHEQGGFTVHPITGNEPKTGYAVSPFPEDSFVKPLSELTEDHVYNYFVQHLDRFEKDKSLHVGGWVNTEHKAMLDLSIVIQDRADALRVGIKHRQEGIFDLVTKETILTGHKGHAAEDNPG